MIKKIISGGQTGAKLINQIASIFRIQRSSTKISDEVRTALKRAIHEKDAGRPTEALHILDEIIREDPDNPMALFVKSVILWEDFKDPTISKLGLQRVKQLVPRKKDKLNRMASELMENIERPYIRKMNGK
jgi:hypothetical protein